MEYSEDHIALAAEYALGTLDAGERAQVESMMSADSEFAAIVQAWEFRLGVLNQMVGSVEPRPVVWENIRSAVAPAAAPEAPAPAEPTPIAPPTAAAEPAAPPPAAAEAANVILLSGRARRWRGVARVTSALAAALIALLGLQIFQPDYLPNFLRPQPRTRVVEVKTPAPTAQPSAQYVAILQGQAGGPAFILTVDGATKNFTIRKVGAPPAKAGKSYELWLISDKLPQPRSLGVIGTSDFTERRLLRGYDSAVIDNATYAVTLEQAGGSPDGKPHSSPVFTGKLIETVPPTASAPAQKR